MSYCINPDCPHPQNEVHAKICSACGSKLLLRDCYHITEALGQGGFGATFLAKNESLPGNPICVIKQLRPSSNAPHVLDMARELFEREAETLGRIGNHPQLPTLLQYFEENHQFYLVQEYISGLTLHQEIRGSGPLPEAGVKHFLSEILPLLSYIHGNEVIHRDIKPANIIRREQDRKLVLIDFGAVKNRVDGAAMAGNSDMSALTNFAIGTPGFAAPEQMQLRPVYASDIYALGVTCIYLLTGKSPKDLDYNPLTGEMVWRKRVDLSDSFAKVLARMLEASVGRRYHSARELLRALEMEPYMESLAQGLATRPQGSTTNLNTSSLYSVNPESVDSSSPSSSATKKMAAQIRARRQQKERNAIYNSSNQKSQGFIGQIPFPNALNSQGFTAGKPKAIHKLDAQDILKAYESGRRDFTSQNLSGFNLQKASLAGGIFQQSKLAKTNFQGADLSSAVFGQASLNRANLRDANLGRAYFSHADLEGADLRGADLSYAHFSNANLKGANLCGANLSHAKISEEQLRQAKTNWSTVLPNGKRGFW
ncbi:protein kinase domain-containing protein [Lyngbya aestuarii]|uniref:protein kinase domain-containing protein n=1 Tax=Lyngbya aestuarii TaxID=118322 RepID=UPI00403E1BAF